MKPGLALTRLKSVTGLALTDLLYFVQDPTGIPLSRKGTVQDLIDLVPAPIADDISDTTSVHKFTTAADITKLAGAVTGPASVTSGNPAVFSGTTGKSVSEVTFAAFKSSLSLVKADISGLGTSDSPQFTGVEVGHATDTTLTRAAAGVIAVEGLPLYSGVPQNSKSAAYTLVLADAQKHILHPSADTTARTWTIPANSSVAYPVGTAITFVNQHSAGVITIAITSDTMRLAGTGTTGSRTLAADGIATALKVTSTEWIISGTGLT